jgi:hypothetical protein
MTQPPAPASPDPEASRIKSLDQRFGSIEAEQQRQSGILERIESVLAGKRAGAPGAPADQPDIAAQVRKGVEEIEAQRKAEADAAAAQQKDADWRKSVDDRLAEQRPAEPASGRKTRLQRVLFGG